MSQNRFSVPGLTAGEVAASRQRYGSNNMHYKRAGGLLYALLNIIKEPMVILLLAAALLYFFKGETGEAAFMTAAILLISLISLFQEKRSRNALEKLKDLTQPRCRVIRDGAEVEIKSEDLVVGDNLVIEEGTSVMADGIIKQSNDFSVNESVLTGESLSVYKDNGTPDNKVYSGTTVASGLALVTVTAVGNQTQLGKIGKSLESIKDEPTPLELQIKNFVKKMVIAGGIVFLAVWVINYFNTHTIMGSLLQALTLAMSILPEEIPVAFTTFMALGAWRLMQSGVVVKQMKTVETLGSATVICVDKTGTITQNKMSLAGLYDFHTRSFIMPKTPDKAGQDLITLAMWASEPVPFDPMEVALHHSYSQFTATDKRKQYRMVHEYPIGGKPPMMTHIFENAEGHRIIAAKGAPEALISLSGLAPAEKEIIQDAANKMAAKGHRVLGVAEACMDEGRFPETQQQFKFTFRGLVAFYDPPKDNIKNVFEDFYRAGIAVKIITGDNAITTMSIAKEVGFRGYNEAMTGDELMQLTDNQLKATVMQVNIFSRMFPEAKLRIVNALKANNQVVAMTGDGVNDGPALKAAHIGIAMGKKGTEIAKNAASLILADDEMANMVAAIAMGRKIYANLKKAIRYIISIHIPILLTVLIPLAFGWDYPAIFTPLHVIFFELIMGPTCSIIYENEPMEEDAMRSAPRPFTNTFFNIKELAGSILQGLVISAGTLAAYRLALYMGYNESTTRTMVFTVLITANIVLTLINRSFYHSLFTTLKYKNKLIGIIITITVLLMAVLLTVPYFRNLFGLAPASTKQLLISISIGFVSVIWYEAVKWIKRKRFKASIPSAGNIS